MNVVWYRLRVSESQRHTPIKIFPSIPPPGSRVGHLNTILAQRAGIGTSQSSKIQMPRGLPAGDVELSN